MEALKGLIQFKVAFVSVASTEQRKWADSNDFRAGLGAVECRDLAFPVDEDGAASASGAM